MVWGLQGIVSLVWGTTGDGEATWGTVYRELRGTAWNCGRLYIGNCVGLCGTAQIVVSLKGNVRNSGTGWRTMWRTVGDCVREGGVRV